ncbi:hypothetical protein V6Z11_A06G170700 [Gossypium hirsutum]
MGTNITSQNENLSNFYTRLWNLSIPSKIRIHLWRVSNDFSPTRGVLKSCKLAWLVEEFMKANILECRKLAISFWALWYNRNKFYHEGIRDRVQDVLEFINAYLMEINQLNNLSHSISTPEQIVWEPPEGDAIKFNFDTSFTRNKEGLVMASCTYLWENIPDPTTAEARACFKAISFTEELDFGDIEGPDLFDELMSLTWGCLA